MIDNTPSGIYKEYTKGTTYKTSLNVYDNVKLNQNFYLGKQWEGVNAPDIEKPVLNIVRQAIDYYISMLVSDDIGIQPVLPDDIDEDVRQAIEFIIVEEMEKIFEEIKFKQNSREFLKNCALDGSHAFYFWFNPDKENQTELPGAIEMVNIDCTNVIFADPTEHNIQLQDYVIVVQNLPKETVMDMFKANEDDVDSSFDDDTALDEMESYAREVNKYVTVLTKFWKDDKGIVKVIKTTNKHILMKETSLDISLYPISWMSWRRSRNSYHGESPITPIRPNQIMINKYYMMINEFTKKLAFPKLFYDKTKLTYWSNKIEAIGVNGNPNEIIASSSPNMQLGNEIVAFIDNLIQKTKDALGIYDAAIGNTRPENTSAIIAIQKAASQPLELQKMDYYQMIEDSVRIIMDLMSANYGIRNMKVELPSDEPELQGELVPVEIPFNFSDLASNKVSVVIEVGAASYWSELMQIQTIDNMFRAGIIPNAKTYVEQMPNGIIKSKQEILEAIEEANKIMQQQAQNQMQQESVTQGLQPDLADLTGAMQQ